MSRAILVGLCLVILPTASSANGWTYSLFDSTEHDFGRVARGTQLTHQFTLTNTTGRDLRIKRVRVSCNCTKASATDRKLRPGESAAINAVMETSGFQGAKSVTIFVQLDRPRGTEIPLRISCTSVGNIASSINEVDFGIVAAGTGAQKKLQLDYAGASDWQITAVDYGSPHLQAEVVEVQRDSSAIRYELVIGLKPDAPPGKLEDRIRLHTNNASAPIVLVDVHAKVEADLEVAPKTLPLKGATAGSEITRNFVIKGQEPFRIVGVEETSIDVQVRCAPVARESQLVVVSFKVPADAGQIPDEIELVTDLENGKTLAIPIER